MSTDLNDDKKYFSSSDLALCATLVALGFNLDSLDKTNPQKTFFVFNRTPELEISVQSFWDKQIKIEPISFFEAQRFLKSRIYGG